MDEDLQDQNEKIIKQLELANRQIAKQNSFSRMFIAGIIYGIGFFVGSAIIATILFGILGPVFGQIGWVRNSYQAGSSMMPR